MTADAATEAASPEAVWARALSAAEVFAAAPFAIGGILVRAPAGPVVTLWIDTLNVLLGDERPLRPIPAHISEDRLLGGLDLTATLAAGRPVMEPGVLAEAAGGTVLLRGIERFPRATIAHITAAIDGTDAGSIAALAIDERREGDEEAGPPVALTDRLGLVVDLSALSIRDARLGQDRLAAMRRRVKQARAAGLLRPLAHAHVPDIVRLAMMLGIDSLRAPYHCLRAAAVLAACDGRSEVAEADITSAVLMTLAPRATQMPAPDEPEDAEPDDAPEPPPDQPPDAPQADDNSSDGLADRLVAAVRASLPANLLAELAAGLAADARGASGPAGAGIKSLQRGRAFASRPGLPRGGARLNLIDTLRAAAPWQPLRRDASGDGDSPVPQLKLAKSDLRIYRRRDTSETLAIFVVDASGSSAAERLAEAKGAVELLLGQTYARRDQVALVAVRGTEAQVLLPPTRSLTRAKRLLAGLPGGGGTPLASGLEAGLQLAAMAKRRGQSPMMIALTDGQANIDRTGQPGRPAAFADAIAAARGIRGTRLSAIVIDTSQRPQPRAREIADAMGARYLPLPRADAAGVAAAVGGIAESVARP